MARPPITGKGRLRERQIIAAIDWIADNAGGGGDVAIADVTGLQAALDAKADTSAIDPYPWTVVTLAEDFVNSTTTAQNVTGFSFTPAANKGYLIEIYASCEAAATTTGARPGWTWPTGLTLGTGWMQSPNSATASAQVWGSAASGEVVCSATGVAVANRPYMHIGQAHIIAGSSVSGAFQIRLRSEIAASAVTMKAGSFMRIREF